MSISERNAQTLASRIETLDEKIELLRAELALANREIAQLKQGQQQSEADKLAELVAGFGSGPTSG